jgi:hypothetical protein
VSTERKGIVNDTDIDMENRIWANVVARRREDPQGFKLTWQVCPGCYEEVAETGPRRSAPSGQQLWHVGCFYEIGLPLWEAEAKRWGY